MYKTLIVDDNPVFRKILREILVDRFENTVILEAANGPEAMQKTVDERPHLIFMDIRIPGESGLILTRRIKHRYPETVVVIITNHDLMEYRNTALDNGAAYFLSKGSSNVKELQNLVESIFTHLGDSH